MLILQAVTNNPITSALDFEKLGIVGVLFLSLFFMYKFLTKQIKENKEESTKRLDELKEENDNLKKENVELREQLLQIRTDLNGRFENLLRDNTEALKANTQFFMDVWKQKPKSQTRVKQS